MIELSTVIIWYAGLKVKNLYLQQCKKLDKTTKEASSTFDLFSYQTFPLFVYFRAFTDKIIRLGRLSSSLRLGKSLKQFVCINLFFYQGEVFF